MTQIKGFGAYQNQMMSKLNQKQKAESDKALEKAKDQEKIRAAKRDRTEKTDKADKDTEVQLSDKAKADALIQKELDSIHLN